MTEKNNYETLIRPKKLEEYIGQEELKENMRIYISAAKLRKEPLDHVLLYGPPGLGKTTLAGIIASELDGKIKIISAPSIEKTGDLAAILSQIKRNDILFIDEIHRIPKYIEEILYSAMEDYCLDIIVGHDVTAHTIKIELPPFTLVGATTKIGNISSPLRDRFGIIQKIEYYNDEELTQIVKRTSRVLKNEIDDKSATEIAKRSRGTPRVANRLFKRVRDYALILNEQKIDESLTKTALTKLKVDALGLDNTDYNILKTIIEKFNGGPVGIETLSASIGEEQITIEEVYEPFLLQRGLIKRTSRGRVATRRAYEHLKIKI